MPLLRPSVGDKNHNYQQGRLGVHIDRHLVSLKSQPPSESQMADVHGKCSFSPVELEISSEALIQKQIYYWYVELSQFCLFDSALGCVVHEEVLEIRSVPSSIVPVTQYDTLPQDTTSNQKAPR